MIRKADVILAAALVVLGLALSYFMSFGDDAGDELKITVNGEIFGTYSLAENRTVDVISDSGLNRVLIEDGRASVTSADCSGQDCVHQHAISKPGETIVCLPNRVILEVTGGEKAYDSISR